MDLESRHYFTVWQWECCYTCQFLRIMDISEKILFLYIFFLILMKAVAYIRDINIILKAEIANIDTMITIVTSLCGTNLILLTQ